MTPGQIRLVQESFAKVAPIAEPAATMFYDRLFALDPSLRPLFKGDMKEQGQKLMSMISVVVTGLTNLEKIVPAVQKLGERHVDYNVRPEHYGTVGAALLWTLEHGLGDDFTPEVRDAWATAYGILSDTMIAAAQSKAA